MSENTEHKVDRTGWDRGPWDSEPDRLEWRHAGLPCLIVRNRSGALCGYVGLPPGHRMHGVDYGDIRIGDEYPDVHGGLTYTNACQGVICHVPREGEPAEVWWLGFDCAHYMDLAPGSDAKLPAHLRSSGYETYRDVPYVRREVNRLAEQMASIAPESP